ncbi:MAG: T9SS type A sorting domain-containing protein [bacterium]|nr:T9SS type A sorting domain-containing protein [bacterium]
MIWHIDEQVTLDGIDDNRVNANPERRGVDLVEADGSQDIGREYGFATSGSGTELGIQEDCWYRDNRAFRDANGESVFVRFNDNTRPSARLNSHAYTFLEISGFSDVADVMSCRIRGTLVEEGFPVTFADCAARWTIADLDGDSLGEFYVQTHDSLFTVDSLGARFVSLLPPGALLQRSTTAAVEPQNELLFIGTVFGVLDGFDIHPVWPFVELPEGAGAALRAFYCQTGTGEERYVVDFANGAGVYSNDLTLLGTDEHIDDTIVEYRYLDLAPARRLVGLSDTRIHALAVGEDLSSVWSVDVNSSWEPIVVIESEHTLIYDQAIGYLDAADGVLIGSVSDCLPPDIDWDGDGRMDGGGAEGADLAPREDYALDPQGDYAYHDMNFDGEPDVLETVAIANDGGDVIGRELVAFDHETHRYADFPMAIAGEAQLVRLNPETHRLHLVTQVVDGGNALISLMRFPISPDGTAEEVYEIGDELILIGPARPQVHERGEFVYCWPNPTSDISRIRVTLPYAAVARVKIFDLAGREVARLEGSSSTAGAFEIPWSTSSVQSGVYIARVETTGGGLTQSSEVKIAVVR